MPQVAQKVMSMASGGKLSLFRKWRCRLPGTSPAESVKLKTMLSERSTGRSTIVLLSRIYAAGLMIS